MTTTRSPLPATAALAGYLALGFFAAYWFLAVMSYPVGADLAIYRDAYLEARAGGDPYQPFEIGVSFVNHPFLLTLMGFASGTAVWLTISALAWAAISVALLRLLGSGPVAANAFGPLPVTRPVLVALLLTFAPAWETLLTGQVNHLAMLCLLVALACDLAGRDWAAGLALALAIALKTSPAVFLAYYLVTGRWRVITGAGLGLLVVTGVAVAQFGGRILPQWLAVLPEIGATIRPSKFNQSILALAYRQLEPLGWDGLATTLILVHKLAFAAILGVVLYRAWRWRVGAVEERMWWFATLLTVVVVFSPLVWLHHSVFLVLAIVLLLREPEPRTRWLALAALVLIQFDRVFEHVFTRHAWPVLLAHGILLVLMLRSLPRRAAR